LAKTGLASGSSEGKRLINQGAVKIDGEKVADPDCHLVLRDGVVISVGKRKFARISIEAHLS
jgi:tyrosyl-tRNA synthetase